MCKIRSSEHTLNCPNISIKLCEWFNVWTILNIVQFTDPFVEYQITKRCRFVSKVINKLSIKATKRYLLSSSKHCLVNCKWFWKEHGDAFSVYVACEQYDWRFWIQPSTFYIRLHGMSMTNWSIIRIRMNNTKY